MNPQALRKAKEYASKNQRAIESAIRDAHVATKPPDFLNPAEYEPSHWYYIWNLQPKGSSSAQM